MILTQKNSHLKGILTIRLIMVVCQLLLMWFLRNSTSSQLHLIFAAVILFALSIYSCFSLWRLKVIDDVSNRHIFNQLLVDLTALTLWLYFLGGAQNPFVSYFLVPICISAALLPKNYTWTLFVLALSAYSVLFFINQPLTDLAGAAHSHHQSSNTGIQLHFIGMWANFLISALLISFFISKMAKTVRDQQNHLNQLREQQLQNQQLSAIGSLAAGTAHELGTPLNTMLLLSEQLTENNPRNIELMKLQIKRCQDLLQKLVDTARFTELDSGYQQNLIEFIKTLLDQWQLMRAHVSFSLTITTQGESPVIQNSLLLQQAINNLLNNAANANPDNIQIYLEWSSLHWQLTIEDSGPGFNQETLKQAGKTIINTKHGMGIGLLISQSAITQLNGQLLLSNKVVNDDVCGARAKIILPIAPQQVLT